MPEYANCIYVQRLLCLGGSDYRFQPNILDESTTALGRYEYSLELIFLHSLAVSFLRGILAIQCICKVLILLIKSIKITLRQTQYP